MTLANVMKKQNPHKCEGFAVVVTETNKPATFYPNTVIVAGFQLIPEVFSISIVLTFIILY